MTKYIIYMASGSASRFGRNKLLEPLGGKPLFAHGLEAMVKAAELSGDTEVRLVSRYPEIREYGQKLGVRAVDSPDSAKGASYTIRAGIQSLPEIKETDYLLFAVADQPYVNPESVVRLLDLADGKTVTARLFCGDRPGNPVLFAGSLVPELLALKADQGGGCVVRNHPCIPVSITDPREFLDLDSPKDLQNL